MKATLFIAKRTFSVLLLSFISHLAVAQQHSAGVNIDSPNPNAVLHLVSPNNNQGLLIPKLTTIQRNAMSLTPADNGLMVYDSTLNEFFFWSGIAWIGITNTDAQDLANVLAQGNDAGNVPITGVVDPSNPQDVATKNYVDTQDHTDDQDLTEVLLSGNSAGGNNITDVLNPVNPLDVANKDYVDNRPNPDLVTVLNTGNSSGGFNIIDVADPVNPQDAATKNYVDTQADSDNQDLASVLGFGASANNSIIADVLDPISPQDAATKNYVDTQGDSDNQDLASVLSFGTDAAGSIIANVADPIGAQDVATKNYVDTQTATIAANSVNSGSIADGSIVNVDVNAAAAIAGTKINPNFGTQNIITTGNISGTLAANTVGGTALQDNSVTTAKIVDGTIANADVNSAAAIAGSKINPNFGAQTITTTGNIVVTGTVDGRDVSNDAADQTALNNLTGVAAGQNDLGTFTGTTISNTVC